MQEAFWDKKNILEISVNDIQYPKTLKKRIRLAITHI